MWVSFDFLKHGDLFIQAQFEELEDNGPVLVMTRREDFEDTCHTMLGHIKELSLEASIEYVNYIREAVREALLKDSRPPMKDKNFTHDLTMLLFVKILLGHRVLDGTHVQTMCLVVNPDESLPWHQRGMLSPELEKTLNAYNKNGKI